MVLVTHYYFLKWFLWALLDSIGSEANLLLWNKVKIKYTFTPWFLI